MKSTNKNILHLDKISKKNKASETKEVSDVLALLQTNENPEEIKILKQIGLDHHIVKAEEINKNIQRFSVLEKKFGRNVYSANQIQEYCESNGYKAIRVDKFKHEVPVEVGKAIIEFAKENTKTQIKGIGEEQREVQICDINLQVSYFFLLTSIQSVNGAPVKHATLFYRENSNHDNYNYLKDNDMLIEVSSWGTAGQDKPLLWYYFIDGEMSSFGVAALLFIGIILMFFFNMHAIFLVFAIISIITITIHHNKDFWKWNTN